MLARLSKKERMLALRRLSNTYILLWFYFHTLEIKLINGFLNKL